MLGPLRNKLASKRIILASSSPRRIQLLESVGFPFKCLPSTFEENLDPKNFKQLHDFAIETAKEKALEVAHRVKIEESTAADLVIGADTIVTFDNKVYGKPKDRDDAFNMLKKFSGKSHTVYTGVVLVTPKCGSEEFCIKSFHEATEVTMSELNSDVLEDYIKTGEPMDKAGGYGIQALGGTFIERIDGDYYNVTGFPLNRFCREVSLLFND